MTALALLTVIISVAALNLPLARNLLRKTPQLPLLAADRLSARRHLVAALHQAAARNDFQQSAMFNAVLAQEAFQRAYRTLKAWEKFRDPETGLVPRNGAASKPFWNPRDAAADLFPFLLLATQYLDSPNERLWLDALAKEREICGPMPCTVSFQPASILDENLSSTIFGAAEYSKDGLLAVTERSGRGSWFARLEEIAQSVIAAASVETKRGKIPASDTEVNGDMLQVLVRLYWATKKVEYLVMAERIAEAYLFDVLPQNQYLPPIRWDFSEKGGGSNNFSFRDHGNEIIPGLAELYFLERMHHRPQAQRYRPALKRFYDRIVEVGRTDDGLWYNVVDVKTHKPVDKRIVDTWGYILNALHTFDLADGTSVYSDEIRRAMRAASTRKSFPWDKRSHDGYADAIESMLYLLPWFADAEYARWIDDEIEVMFHMQAPSGLVSGRHLDGNFIRTALLYATYKTQGTTAHPWRDDMYLGASYDLENKDLYVYLSAGTAWKGVLRLDSPRHRTIWNLPFEYPRLNGTPEWFIVEPAKTYAVVDVKTGARSLFTGRHLANGLKMELGESNSNVLIKISAASR